MAGNGDSRLTVPQTKTTHHHQRTLDGLDAGSSVSERYWAAIAAGVLMLVVGLIAYFANQPFIYPSLGPTAFLQAELPFHRSAQFRDTTIGHVIGVIAGLASVFLLGATNEPRIGSGTHLSALRIGAAALTVTLVIVLENLVKVSNPPSASTGLLFALGYFQPHLRDVIEVLAGVLFLASFGALIRHIHLRSRNGRQPVDPSIVTSGENRQE